MTFKIWEGVNEYRYQRVSAPDAGEAPTVWAIFGVMADGHERITAFCAHEENAQLIAKSLNYTLKIHKEHGGL